MGVVLSKRKICSCKAETTSAPNESDTVQRSWPVQAQGLFGLVDEGAVFCYLEDSLGQTGAFTDFFQSWCIFQEGNASVQLLHRLFTHRISDASAEWQWFGHFEDRLCTSCLKIHSTSTHWIFAGPFLPPLQTIPLVDTRSPPARLCAHQSLSLFPAVLSAASPFTACSGCCKAFTLLIFPKQTQ